MENNFINNSDSVKPIEVIDDINQPSTDNVEVIVKNKNKRSIPSVSIPVVILLVILAILITFQTTYTLQTVKLAEIRKEYQSNIKDYDDYALLYEMIDLFKDRYIYDLDMNMLSDALLHVYSGYSGDKYSIYYNKEEAQEYFRRMGGSSYGIGTYIYETDEGFLLTWVMENSPAMRAGLQNGDIIYGVEDKLYSELGSNLTSLILGDIGTSVKLLVDRNGEKLTFDVVRAQYETQTVISRGYEKNGHKIGYIMITNFYDNTPNAFYNAVSTALANGCEALVFDVRGNSGGTLGSIVSILDFLLPEGTITSIWENDPNGGLKLREEFKSDSYSIDVPMVVLVNEKTASAAEMFTIGLKDYEKALVVGTKTYGKGCGQTSFPLSNGGVVNITSFLYNPPVSDNYDGIGIIPNVEISLPEDAPDNLFILKDAQDTQLNYGLNYLYDKISK